MRWFHCAIALGLHFLLTGSLHAEESDCQRLVEFRDGSILRLQLPAEHSFDFRQASSDESAPDQASPLRLGDPLALRFSRLPALAQLRTIQAAVKQLDSDVFGIREQALRALVSGGNGFRPFLEQYFNSKQNPETRWRLARAIRILPAKIGFYEHAYDEVVTNDGTLKGDLANWQLKVDYLSGKVRLDRTTVRSIRHAPPLRQEGSTPIIATTERIRKDLDVLFPADCVRIDFETDSNGDKLRPGQDISRRFIIDGMLMSTSIEDSFVSVNDTSLDSRSGEQSAATHRPLFHGTVTLTFCVPGNVQEPAGVTHIGLWVGVVQPGGTSLVAYDSSGHQISKITTEAGPNEFLALHSTVPIHRVEIIPHEKVDDDVTIDDIVFPIPTAINSGGSKKHFSLDFVTGERIVCPEFEITTDHVSAAPAGEFTGAIKFPLDSLRQLSTPTDSQVPPAANGENLFWLLLDDGSTILAGSKGDGVPPKTRFAGVELEDLSPTAVWADGNSLLPLPDGTSLAAGQIATILTKAPTFLTEPKFTSAKFTAKSGDAIPEWSYNRLPTVWLKNPNQAAGDRATGFLRFNSGERIVLGEGSFFQLKSFNSKTITLYRDGKKITVATDAISTLRLPLANP